MSTQQKGRHDLHGGPRHGLNKGFQALLVLDNTKLGGGFQSRRMRKAASRYAGIGQHEGCPVLVIFHRLVVE